MRKKSKIALSTICCFITLDLIAIFALAVVGLDPDTFNPIMTGLTWPLCGLLSLGLGITAYELCLLPP